MKKIIYGHTLVELLLVCVIISILSYFAIPVFTQHFMREKRLEAKFMLIKVADALEEFHFEHHTYRDATLAALGFSDTIADAHYKLRISAASSEDYSLAAVPQNSQTNDKECGTLLLSATGVRASTGTAPASYCWQ